MKKFQEEKVQNFVQNMKLAGYFLFTEEFIKAHIHLFNFDQAFEINIFEE